jgi:general secretion pathway protein B
VIGIALLANAAIFGAWLTWWANPQAAVAEVQPIPTLKQSAAGPEQSEPTRTAQTTPDATPPVEAAAVTQPPQSRTQPRFERIALSELPSSARAGFPGLAFSTHIFADDPALRAVVINGTRRTEGELVEGMTIEEITEGGVVLHFGEYLVEISVLESWEDD